MRARRTTQIGSYIFGLVLFITACGDRTSEPQAPAQKPNPQSGAPRLSIIQAPAAVRDRVRIDPVAMHVVPEVVTAPGEVALDLKQVAEITSRIEGQVEKIHVQLGDRVKAG